MTGQHSLSRVLIIVAAIAVFGALGYAAAPFTTGGQTIHIASPAGAFDSFANERSGAIDAVAALTPPSSCGAALIDAWHSKSPPSGWFSYAPLVNTAIVAGSRCRSESRQRLLRSGYALAAAGALVVIARRIRRPRPGLPPAAGGAPA